MYLQGENSFLGRGWTFPPKFNDKTLLTEMVSDEADIEESIRLLLSTTPGERLMRPAYGCDLQGIVFKSIDLSIISQIKGLIAASIRRFEPRIDLEEIMVDTKEELDGLIRIHLFYTVRGINIRTNIVYPYYFKEGTNLRDM